MFNQGSSGDLHEFVETVNENFRRVNEQVSELMRYQQTQIAKDLTKSAISQMMGYNRRIFTIGFAAVVASWIQFKADMNPLVFRIAGLSWMVSVTSFVAFEIWKMVTTSNQRARQLKEGEGRLAASLSIKDAPCPLTLSVTSTLGGSGST